MKRRRSQEITPLEKPASGVAKLPELPDHLKHKQVRTGHIIGISSISLCIPSGMLIWKSPICNLCSLLYGQHTISKFSQLPNLPTFITLSLFNVLAVLALHPSLLLFGDLHYPLKIVDRSLSYSSPSLWKLELTPFISSSTSVWYQFLHFRLTYSFTYHFFF